MFNSFDGKHALDATWLLAWLRERIVASLWWLVPLAFVISMAGGWIFWFFRAAVAMVALVFLRLWDDLEDVEHDRLRHPKRILCKTASLSRAYGLCTVGLAALCVLAATTNSRWIGFVSLILLVSLASRLRRRWHDSALRVVFAHVILLKVPALVISLARPEVGVGVVGARAMALYGFIGAYEVVHDAEVRQSPHTGFFIFVDVVCLLLGLTMGIIEETRT